jgi:hypothetical protein
VYVAFLNEPVLQASVLVESNPDNMGLEEAQSKRPGHLHYSTCHQALRGPQVHTFAGTGYPSLVPSLYMGPHMAQPVCHQLHDMPHHRYAMADAY